jgi:hypothetical protein
MDVNALNGSINLNYTHIISSHHAVTTIRLNITIALRKTPPLLSLKQSEQQQQQQQRVISPTQLHIFFTLSEPCIVTHTRDTDQQDAHFP